LYLMLSFMLISNRKQKINIHILSCVFFCCRIIWADDKCDGKESLGRLVEIHDGYDIDGVLGLPCSFGNHQ